MPEKAHRANKNQKLLRLYGILMFSGISYSLIDLSQKLKCSKQTVLRLINDIDMSAKGELQSWIGDGGKRYYKMKPPPVKPNVALSAEDIQHLLMCHDLLTHLLPNGIMDDVNQVIGHAGVLLKEFEDRDKAFRSNYAAKGGGGIIDYTPKQQIIETLEKGINNRTTCTVLIESTLNEMPIQLNIAPLEIVSYKQGLYVKVRNMVCEYAYEAILSLGRLTGEFVSVAKELQYIAIHRIFSVELTPNEFVEEKVENADKDLFGMDIGEKLKVRVLFSPLVAGYIRKRIWSDDQSLSENTNGEIVLTFTAGNADEVLSWILSFGSQARVLEPFLLRRKVASVSKELSLYYHDYELFQHKGDDTNPYNLT